MPGAGPLRSAAEEARLDEPEGDPAAARAAEPAATRPTAAATERGGEDRPLTLGETLAELQARYAGMRGGWRARALVGALLVIIGALVWLVLSRVIPWSGGIIGSIQDVLALDVAWAPVPAPDDPVVAADTGLGTAAWVGAPLVVAVFWFAAAHHLDRASRRTFGTSRVPGVRHSAGYTVMAIVVVFPLIVLGLVSGAWGVFALISWAAAHEAWGSTVALVALLLGFGGFVRLASAMLERRAASR